MSETENTFPRTAVRLAAIVFGVALPIVGVAAFDRVVIASMTNPFPPPMPANTRVEYRTTEFQWTVETNELGLRELPFEWSRKTRPRILAIGDSFTLGWGVALEDAWVKVLEKNLRAAGLGVDVVNAGKGGMGTAWYADAAESMVPVLRPDLVVIGVLQGDDLAQALPFESAADAATVPTAPLWRRTSAWAARAVAPNLVQWRESRRRPPDARVRWRKDAQERITRMNAQERSWYDRLDPTVAQMFREGDVNPGLVTLAMAEPDHLRMTLHPSEAKTRDRVEAMVSHLQRIRAVCARFDAKVLVAPVPYGAFVSRRQWDAIRRVGFDVEEEFLTSTLPDDLIRDAAARAGVASMSATAPFREQGSIRPLYFVWDGHFNPAGHTLFAETLMPSVAAYFSPLRAR